ncbi:MAG: 3-hydroxyacyl-ACP dehydratase FabZ [Deinococcus sp.]|nr:3-hydroxyacyl-ACP dehydratase FabZ [Deinococcus sp.]
MEAKEILTLLPHRFPFLMVDRVLELGEKHVVAVKNVTLNEPFFPGHFPGNPVMPGVLIVEALVQASALILARAERGSVFYLASVEHARFRRPVLPGDQLILRGELQYYRQGVGRAVASAYVGGEVAAEAEFRLARGRP